MTSDPVFHVMDFKVHYDATRGGVGWQELKKSYETNLRELTFNAHFNVKVWANRAKVGEYCWPSVEKYIARIR